LELSEAFTLSSSYDLCEDTRREMDDIYIALAEIAKRRSIPEKLESDSSCKNNEQ